MIPSILTNSWIPASKIPRVALGAIENFSGINLSRDRNRESEPQQASSVGSDCL